MLIRVSDAAVMLFLVFVFRSIWRGIATKPELLDKLIAFGVGRQLLKSRELLSGNDPPDIFVKPLLIRALELFDLCSLVFGTRTREGVLFPLGLGSLIRAILLLRILLLGVLLLL